MQQQNRHPTTAAIAYPIPLAVQNMMGLTGHSGLKRRFVKCCH